MSFSCQESILRATRYLPELVQLQKQMFDFSHRRLDRKEAAKLPVRDYVQSLPGKQLHIMLAHCHHLVLIYSIIDLASYPGASKRWSERENLFSSLAPGYEAINRSKSKRLILTILNNPVHVLIGV